MGIIYLAALATGIACMLLLDLAFLLAWDIAGIGLGIFLRGDGEIATGILLAPELPIEEPVFLLFLILCTMVIFTGSQRLIDLRRDRVAR